MSQAIHKGHKARKRFGQNFLIEENIIAQIAQSIGASSKDSVIEIGPGLGAITEPLLATGCKLQLVELDRDLIDRLEQTFAKPIQNEQLFIENKDILKVDLTELIARHTHEKAKVIGNLPYNISSPLLFHVIDHQSAISEMTFMLQKEVVNRICAQPSTSAYSALSIIIQLHCETRLLFDVPAEAFNPPPKVGSAIVQLTPQKIHQRFPQLKADQLSNPAQILEFRSFVHQCFQQRRKTLRNNLKEILSSELIESLGIDPQRRPETLSIDESIALFYLSKANN